jgi:hypothetical protein
MNNRLIVLFKWLAVVGFLFISTVPAHADQKSFCKGVGSAVCAAADKRDWTVAAKEMKPLVDKNNAIAMGWLAWLYSKGKGVPKDLLTARTLTQRALNIGQGLSAKMVERLQKSLSKIEKEIVQDADEITDPAKKLKRYKLLVEKSFQKGVRAQVEGSIAFMYYVGEEGVPRSDKKALAWFERAKKSGDTDKGIDEIISELKTKFSQDSAKIERKIERKRGELLLQDFVYGSDIRKLENLGKSVETLCKRDIKCAFDKVWVYLDITKDGRLSLSEIARFQRNILKFSVAHQNKNKLKTEDFAAINLASIIFFPITASSILHSFDYNNDGVLSKKEVFGDTEFSKLVGVDVDTLATGLDFQSLGKKLQDSMGNIPFLK